MSIIKERVSSQYPIIAISHFFTTLEPVESDPIDTSGYEDGVYFAMLAYLPGSCQVSLTFEHSEIPSGFGPVSADNVIYRRAGGPIQYDISNDTGSTQTMQGLPCVREGLRNTKRYVRAKVTPSRVAGSTVIVLAILDSETSPTPKVITHYFPPVA